MLLLAGCTAKAAAHAAAPARTAPAEELKQADRFAKDAAFRRHWLEESLADRESGYARERLAHYTEADWGRLPVAQFPTRPIVPADLGRLPPRPDGRWQAMPSGPLPASLDGLKRRGEQMFTRFPAQVERALLPVLRDTDGPARYGLWQTRNSVGGLVWVALPGGVYPALTCSSCHSSVDAKGRIRPGVPNHRFDLGQAKDDYVREKTLYSTWGPGRVDLAPDGQDNPVVIADLRPVRFQRHLHRTANLRNSLPALALRAETGLILAHQRAIRPEPGDAFALAYYLWRLGDAFAAQMTHPRAAPPAFARNCGPCHQGPSLVGDTLAPEFLQSPVATMPSSARGTGRLRTPSLLGVSARRWLLYGGEAEGIDGLLDPGRTRGGHTFARGLDAAERKAIADYLKAL
jgi:mono/diheme cytochrome c family protein